MNKSGGKFWGDAEVEELKDRFQSRPYGETKHEFASRYAAQSGRTQASVYSKIGQLEAEGGMGVPVSRYEKWDNPPKMAGDALILMDLHIPYHDADFANKCISLAKKWGIKKLILGGDALDARAFSHWPEDFEDGNKKVISSELEKRLLDKINQLPQKHRMALLDEIEDAHRDAGDLSEEIAESRVILRSIAKAFDEVLWMMGNHEGWVVKTLQRALSAGDLAAIFDADNPKWKISPYYFCTLTSEDETYQIEHPRNSGKGSSKRLVPKFGSHIIMGHNHHFSVQTDPSGRWLAIEPGMACDERRMAYVQQRHTTADEHVVGAVLVRKGYPHLLNRFTDWELLGAYKGN